MSTMAKTKGHRLGIIQRQYRPTMPAMCCGCLRARKRLAQAGVQLACLEAHNTARQCDQRGALSVLCSLAP